MKEKKADKGMKIFSAEITLVDRLFFRHRELDKLVETSRNIHNYALTYSIYNAIGKPLVNYMSLQDSPTYKSDLQGVKDLGFYITPAKALDISYTMETTNVKSEKYTEKMGEDRGKTYPSGHKLKLADIGSKYLAIVFLGKGCEIEFPHNIRLGKLMSKAKVDWKELDFSKKNGDFEINHPLNPMDLPEDFKEHVKSADYLRMSPTGLIKNISVSDHGYYHLNNGDFEITLPTNMEYMEYNEP